MSNPLEVLNVLDETLCSLSNVSAYLSNSETLRQRLDGLITDIRYCIQYVECEVGWQVKKATVTR